MEVKAELKMTRISAFKARDVARHVQGMPALGALDLLEFYPQKAARLIHKVLKSAVANAENNHSLDPAMMIIKQAQIGEGPTIHRFAARARGSANAIRKRTSHIKIILTERDLDAEKAAEAKQKAGRDAAIKARRGHKAAGKK
jgi:large subunit ribosomal protein L22